MVYIYVLQLENNKWYIGKTTNPNQRIDSHFTSNGSTWTKLHRPIRLHHLIPDCDDYDEDKYTKIYMDKYGIDNVRGGSYVQINLDDSLIDNLNRLSRGTNDKCFKCGKIGHFVKDCDKNNNTVKYENIIENKKFDAIEKINIKIKKLKEDIKIYNDHKEVINWLNNLKNNFRPNAKLKFEINKENVIDRNIIDEFDNYKKYIINERNNSQTNNRYSSRFIQDEIYDFQTTMIKIVQLIGGTYSKYVLDISFETSADKMKEFNDNLKYMFDKNASESQIDFSINNMKIYYLEVVNFVKQKEQLLSEYATDFEQLTQQKIIELNKRILNLV